MCRDVTAVERQLDGSKRLEMSDERFDLLKVRERATAAGDRQGQVRYERLFLTHARVVSRWRNDVEQAMTQVGERRCVHAEVQDAAIEVPNAVGLNLDRFALGADIHDGVPPLQLGREARGLDDSDVGERRGIAETPHDE